MNLENLDLAELNTLELQETNGGILPVIVGVMTAAGAISGMFSSWAVFIREIKTGGH